MFHVPFKGGTYVKVGRVYNATDPAFDIIRYQIRSVRPDGCADFACSIDEAATIAAGLNYVVASELAKDGRAKRMYR